MEAKRFSIVNKIYKFLFLITDIFGVGNYYTSKNYTVESSTILKVYGLILLAAISIFFFCNVHRSKIIYTDRTETSLLFFEYVSYWSMSLSCFASSIWKQNKIRDWTQKSRKIILTFTTEQINQLILGYVVIMFAALSLLVIFTVVFYLDSSQPNKTAFSIFSYSTLYGIITVIVLEFVMGVLFLSLLFKQINDELSEILEESRAVEDRSKSMLFVLEYGHLLGKKANFIDSREISRIRLLGERYNFYCSLTRDLNDCFSPQLLLFNCLCFLEITYSVFCFTLSDTNYKIFSVTFITVWFFTYMSFLFSYTAASQRLIDQAKRSGSIVHRIINTETRKTIKNYLEIFSLQIYQSDVQITAMGLFAVNSNLLYEMIGGVSSATVLLIQFQKYSTAEITTVASYSTS